MAQEGVPLLVPQQGAVVTSDTTWWRAVHVLCFATGGFTFIVGTVVLWWDAALLSAVLYIVGSCGFLSVDLQELATFTDAPAALRCNMALSATGSFLYVVGSAGFLPSVYAAAPVVGPWGFILGSAIIGASQTWKTCRLATDGKGAMAPRNLSANRETFTAAGVEASAGVGAYHFLVGTSLMRSASTNVVMAIWVLGSLWFTAGSLFLAWRHFVMHVT